MHASKKAPTLATLAVLAMAVVLVSCAEQQQVTTTMKHASTSSTSLASSSTTTTLATTTTTIESQEPILLHFATGFAQTDAGGRIAERFCDYVEDETAGVVTFRISFDDPGVRAGTGLELVGSGAVDLVSLDQTQYAEQLPLLNFPASVALDAVSVVDYSRYLVFENADTSRLIEAEAASQNIRYLAVASGGPNLFVAKNPFAGLSELVGKRFGAGGLAAAYEAMGLTVEPIMAEDLVPRLADGGIDATRMSLSMVMRAKAYEVAEGVLRDGTYDTGGIVTINLDTWANLTSETQQIFKSAAADSESFSVELSETGSQADVKMLADAGVTVGILSVEEQALWWSNLFGAYAADCLARAEKLGIIDDMIAVVKAAAEFTRTEWEPPAD